MLTLNPVVYLPIELKSRDLDARLLIAAHCLRSGFCVVIGQQWGLHENLETMPRGCVLFKSMNAIPAAAFCRSKAAGHLVVATDEEAVARRGIDFLPHGIDRSALEACDQFFAQSDLHAEAIHAKFPEANIDICVTGNARLDLLSPAAVANFSEEIRSIRDRFAPFILLNTNFTHTNSIWGAPLDVADILARSGALDPESKEDKALFVEYVRNEEIVRRQIVSLIKWAADNLPGVRIIVRPHPAENQNNWLSTFGGMQNLSIVVGQNPVPWIMAAEVLLHSNCTTGLEAAMLGRPTLNLLPNRDSRWAKRYVMSKVNRTFQTWEDIAAVLKDIKHKKKMMQAGAPVESALRRFFPGYKAHDAAEKISARMVALLKKNGVGPKSENAWRTTRQTWKTSERTKVEQEKVSISPLEFQQRFDAMRPLAGLQEGVQFGQIDRSLFLKMPAA